MKKIGTLNQPLSAVIAGLGHMDQLVIADAGLPIPAGTGRIDLALKAGIPGFMDTLAVILEEMQVESVVIAGEMVSTSQQIYQQVCEMLPRGSSSARMCLFCSWKYPYRLFTARLRSRQNMECL